jgi:flagellar hook-basal body complex protein FliE
MIDSIKFDESLKGIYKNLSNTSLKGEDANQKSAGTSFKEIFNKAFNEVNGFNTDADKAITDFATGKNTDIHNTMIAMEKADISFQLMMQVRNKLVAAYQEIYRMQV